jgi:N-formylmaleamate deformylase
MNTDHPGGAVERERYARAELGGRMRPFARPAVVVVDLVLGFTDPESALGGDLSAEVAATRSVLDAARRHGRLVVFTTIAYEEDLSDAGVWLDKLPRLADLRTGSPLVEVDPRLARRRGEPVIVKKGASAFFGTNLAAVLTHARCDGIVLCGATTGGCVRASAVDAVQHGFPTVVPRECVGDRAPSWHQRNLEDIDAKYADVIGMQEAIARLALRPHQPSESQAVLP